PSRPSGFRLRAPAALPPASHLKSWCTGKDSNLRTSLGGTDLQSVGFNHSPTCAKTPCACARRNDATAGHSPIEKQSARESPLARKHHTWKNSLWSAVGKNLLRRRAVQNVLSFETDPANQAGSIQSRVN